MRPGLKWEARDASACLEPLGMFFSYCIKVYFFNCIFLTILKNLLKVLCLQMMTSRVAGREMHQNGDGSSSGARDVLRRNMSQAARRRQYVFFLLFLLLSFFIMFILG